MKFKNIIFNSIICILFGLSLFFITSCQQEHIHDWQIDKVLTEPTCTTDGVTVFKCSGCEETKNEVIKARGHSESTLSGVDSTCTSTGLTDGKYCSICDMVLIQQKVIEMKEHNYVNQVCVTCGYENFTKGLKYQLSQDQKSYWVSGIGQATDEHIIIPLYYNGLPVTEINPYAFKNCSFIKSVTLSDNITTVLGSAFKGCHLLEKVILGDNVNIIYETAFNDCPNLKYNEYGNGLYLGTDKNDYHMLFRIEYSSNQSLVINGNTKCYPKDFRLQFSHPDSPKNLVFEEGITIIYDEMFKGCEYLESVILPNSLRTIGTSAFQNCVNLTNINIPSNLTNINDYVFNGCANLTNISIPDSVYSIGTSAFQNCVNLKNISIPDSVSSIGVSAFQNCVNLTNINIPSNITSINDSVFYGCSNLNNIKIPYTVRSIGSYAFYGCESLENILIPEKVKNIGYYCFKGCKLLSIYCVSSDGFNWNDDWNPDNMPVYWGIDISGDMVVLDGIVYMVNNNDAAIINCYNDTSDIQLNAFVLVDSKKYRLTSIESNVFKDCNNLKNIYFHGSIEDWLNINFSYLANPMYKVDNFYILDSNGEIEYKGNKYSLLTNLVIPNTVKYIKDYQFYGCDSLTNVEISNSVISIGESAFSGCYNLVDISIPNSVTSIGEYAFSSCDNLSNITLSNNLSTIKSHTFFGCDNLVDISIPNSVTSIGERAFSECDNLVDIIIPNSVRSIGEDVFYGCDNLANVTLSNNLSTIGKYAFIRCGSLTSILIPNSVTSIGEGAFSGCINLSNVTLSNNLSTIDKYAFSQCESLTSILIPNSVTSIGECAFSYCGNLKRVELPDSLTVIPSYAFYNCVNLESIELSKNITTINGFAFSECDNLKSIIISSNITYIGHNVFENCDILKIYCEHLQKPTEWNDNWNISNCPVYWNFNEENCFSKDGVNYLIKDDIAIVSGFDNSKKVVDLPNLVTIGNNLYPVSIIDYSAFSNCDNLEKIIIPDSVNIIENAAFSGCVNLKEIIIPNSVSTIKSNTFSNCDSLKIFDIPSSISTIENNAFSNCKNLMIIKIPASVNIMGEKIFSDCPKLKIYCENDSIPSGWNKQWNLKSNEQHLTYWNRNFDNFVIINEVMYEIDNDICTLLAYLGDDVELIIPGNILINDKTYIISSIAPIAFYQSNITKIKLSENIENIGSYAFSECNKLENIELPDSLISIGESAFYSCDSLKQITLPDKIKTITSQTFYSCSNLKNVILPKNLERIDSYAFSKCTSLEKIEFPDSLKYIGNCAFFECNNIHSIYIPNNVDIIGERAFYRTTNLVVYCASEYMKSKWYLNSYCFGSDYDIYLGIDIGKDRQFVIENDILFTFDNNYAYVEECYSDNTKIIIPDYIEFNNKKYEVISISDSAFYKCSFVEEIILPQTLKNIESYAFYGCDKLKEIVIPDKVEVINDSTFYGCINLENVSLSKVVTIGNSAFEECRNLKNIELPETVTSIGEAAFKNSGIENINLPSNLTEIKEYTFNNCDNLSMIIIPKNVSTIGEYAFNNCDNLAMIIIPKNVSVIGEYAFSRVHAYCEVESNPTGWNYNWNSGSSKIIYNFKEFNFVKINDIICEINNNEATIIGLTKTSSCFTIPSTIEVDGNSYVVTSIKKYAFTDCPNLRVLKIPSSIVNIESGAISVNIELIYENDDSYNNKIMVLDNIVYEIINNEAIVMKYLVNDQQVIIPNSIDFENTKLDVTAIGERAFYNKKIKSIMLPDSIVKICEEAFRGCKSLESITLSDGIESIGNIAFGGCESLKSITLPESIVSIGDNAFSGCPIKEITIHSNVINMGSSVFTESNARIYCNFAKKPSGWDDEWLVKKAYSSPHAIWCGNIINNIHYEISNGVATVKDVKDETLNTIIIPNTINVDGISYPIRHIGASAFSYCKSVKNIVIPEGVTSIGKEAFVDCKSLNSIILPDSILTIGEEAFSGCSSLKSITIPKKVKHLEPDLFNGCRNLESVIISNNLLSIASDVFYGCSKILKIYYTGTIIPDGWYFIYSEENNCYFNMNSKNTILIDNIIYEIENDNEVVVVGSVGTLEEINIPNIVYSDNKYYYVTTIGQSAFSGCTSLKRVILSEGIEKIDYYALSDCINLSYINIPKSVKNIDDKSFSGCDNLIIITEDDDYPEGWEKGWNANRPHYSRNEIVIQNGVIYHLYEDYHSNKIMKVVGLDGTEENLVLLDAITIGPKKYKVEPTMRLNFGTTLVKSLVIPEGVTAIYVSNFTSLEIVHLPDTIELLSFSNLVSLEELIIPDNATDIRLTGCNKIKSITIPYGNTIINYRAFKGCSSLEEINLPETIETIRESAFEGCISLKSINLPDSITLIEKDAFKGCTSLESITIPKVSSLGGYAFSYCTNLKKVEFKDNIKILKEGLFAYCINLESVVFNGNVFEIETGVFSGCVSLKTIQIPCTVYSINNRAFSGCINLETIKLPRNLDGFSEAFVGCNVIVYANMEGAKDSWDEDWDVGISTIYWKP